MSIDEHDRFRADVRLRLAATNGAPDTAEIVGEIFEKIPLQRRSEKEAGRLITLLDSLQSERADP